MKIQNRLIKLVKRPEGFPSEDTWKLESETIENIDNGFILVENYYISIDPAMRGWLNEARSYIDPVRIGDVMRAGSIGKVIESKNSKFKKNDIVFGWGGVQEFSISNGDGFHHINPENIPLPAFLGTLGMTGMTAYFGILEVAKIKKGETVLVSAAAGSVGSLVGQIAKIKGCKVIGIAGGEEKCNYVKQELGFDGCIDYKNESIIRGIKRECSNGVDVFFDNVGGETLDAALIFINKHARIVVCGAISQYNEKVVKGPKNYLSLLVNRATMKGMVVFDYSKNYSTAIDQIKVWIKNGKLKSKEDIYEGIDNFYETFKRLFSGEKKGKLVLKIK
tara:strand:- start:590 stop:1591 length:1002 start_codon:yes stop_codon:yes gene_type:complete